MSSADQFPQSAGNNRCRKLSKTSKTLNQEPVMWCLKAVPRLEAASRQIFTALLLVLALALKVDVLALASVLEVSVLVLVLLQDRDQDSWARCNTIRTR